MLNQLPDGEKIKWTNIQDKQNDNDEKRTIKSETRQSQGLLKYFPKHLIEITKASIKYGKLSMIRSKNLMDSQWFTRPKTICH